MGADSATVYFPEFGAEDSYAIQMLNADGTWKTLKTEVEDADARTREGVSEAAADAGLRVHSGELDSWQDLHHSCRER